MRTHTGISFGKGKFNLIRCSEKFYDKLIKYLEECGVTYIERGKWDDGSVIVRQHIDDFCPLFHHFSMLALEENPYIYALFDRVAHCFLNHQYFAQKKFRDGLQFPSLWESKIISHNAMARSHYIGRCEYVWEAKEVYRERLKKIL